MEGMTGALGMYWVGLCKRRGGVIDQGDIQTARRESVRVELSDIRFSISGALS